MTEPFNVAGDYTLRVTNLKQKFSKILKIAARRPRGTQGIFKV